MRLSAQMINQLRQAIHTWYILSCGHIARELFHARGNATDCIACMARGEWSRVFILETKYEKPISDD
jgi:hypothetical protein